MENASLLFGSLAGNGKGLVGMLEKLNCLAIDSVEKVAALQLESAKYYTEIGIDQMRAVSGIRDASAAKEYATSSVGVVTQVNNKILEDSKKIIAANVELRGQVIDIVKGGLSEKGAEQAADSKPAKSTAKKASAA
ncbi:phasin family protein [Sinobacterium caligoides]|uniref:Phasin family protein n=1 Tax=Sinobacterium caligoides TaxID=933926 RepID=A0A3N2DZJ2_9GAMM|nr:phasin family protein [Sinobacterium caligoides]ROS05293.1 phasin family protein [Sinobacterium caligoides]